MCFLCDVRCSSVPPFIPLYPLLHHPPPFSLMGRVALTLFHLRIPHSVNPSSFTPWLQDSLWYLFLLHSPSHSHSFSSPPVLLALQLSLSPLHTVSFLLKRIARLHKWFHVKPTPKLAPSDSLQALAQVYCNRLDKDLELLLTIHHLLTVD